MFTFNLFDLRLQLPFALNAPHIILVVMDVERYFE